MSPIREEMVEQGDITVIPRQHFGFTQKRIVPLRNPNLSVFTAQEIALVEAVIDAGRDANATELSHLSHGFMGWKIAAHKEMIPYEAVFLSNIAATPGDKRRARELAMQYGW